ncbi:hypothetical protein IW261DRAFT_1508220 [Armillaria novae-zelandiae]|uniref:Uncharacterized protein n=1 Tax=Armillaria novae-zelandiae TaxID=153914 RepID=A0AA39NUX4_9AGAR|nr:hypothetical protein IW261DRAFT_1508220 [Armillaria novae-zelandiae]
MSFLYRCSLTFISSTFASAPYDHQRRAGSGLGASKNSNVLAKGLALAGANRTRDPLPQHLAFSIPASRALRLSARTSEALAFIGSHWGMCCNSECGRH